MTSGEAADAFEWCDAVAVIAGRVSGNVEMIDFDLGGEAFDAWASEVRSADSPLYDLLVIETTPSGGRHVAYRLQDGPVPANRKLAERQIEASGPEPVRIGSKAYKPRMVGDRWVVTVTMIETRGEGGLFLCAPTDGYQLRQGRFERLPVITPQQHELLIEAARSLSQTFKHIEDGRPIGIVPPDDGVVRPGDAFNESGEITDLLIRHGWVCLGDRGGNQHWSRPDKDPPSTSATLRDGVFFNFSSNAAPFEPGVGYSRFAVYAMLEHGGDYTAAASHLADEGYGRHPGTEGVDLSGILEQQSREQVVAGGPPSGDQSVPLSYRDLIEAFPTMRPVVIADLLREGESMNVIAPPKTGKSWLTMDLAIAVATGGDWLDRFTCEQGRVLMIDNELHPETSAARLPRVAEARGVDQSVLNDRLYIDNLRGRLMDIHRLRPYLESIPKGRFKVIILDAFYRFLPSEVDENDNGGMARIYNLIDACADRLGCAFVMVHHTSKGLQSGKSVTDVGAGAGAQSRATDTHLVMRPHAEDEVVVLEAAVRSFAPVPPICLRWSYPTWTPDYTLDPTELRSERRRRSADEPDEEAWTTTRFCSTFLSAAPITQRDLIASAVTSGVSERSARRMLADAERQGMAFRRRSPRYSWASTPEN